MRKGRINQETFCTAKVSMGGSNRFSGMEVPQRDQSAEAWLWHQEKFIHFDPE